MATSWCRAPITTFWLMLWSGLLGFALAVAVGIGRTSPNWFINGPCYAFTSVIRGTPLLVQIFLLYYGLGSLFAQTPFIRQTFLWPYLRDGFWYVVLALTLSVGGYVGEVVRGALLSVPRGEMEAARAYGFRGFGLLRRIWLPRALQAMMPTLAGRNRAAPQGDRACLDRRGRRPSGRREHRAGADLPRL